MCFPVSMGCPVITMWAVWAIAYWYLHLSAVEEGQRHQEGKGGNYCTSLVSVNHFPAFLLDFRAVSHLPGNMLRYCLCAVENQPLLVYPSSNLNLVFRTREMIGHCRMLLVKLYCSCCVWIWTKLRAKQKELITLENDTEAWNMNSVQFILHRNCWLQN